MLHVLVFSLFSYLTHIIVIIIIIITIQPIKPQHMIAQAVHDLEQLELALREERNKSRQMQDALLI